MYSTYGGQATGCTRKRHVIFNRRPSQWVLHKIKRMRKCVKSRKAWNQGYMGCPQTHCLSIPCEHSGYTPACPTPPLQTHCLSIPHHSYLDTPGTHRVVQVPPRTHCLSIPCTTITWTLRVHSGSPNPSLKLTVLVSRVPRHSGYTPDCLGGTWMTQCAPGESK